VLLVQVYFLVALMAVASPYAVFRAADLSWPVVGDRSRPVAPAAVISGRPRPPRQRALVVLVQGELFPEGVAWI
jgi:hypothetical protein